MSEQPEGALIQPRIDGQRLAFSIEVDWLVVGFKHGSISYSIGQLKSSPHFLVVEQGDLSVCLYQHVNFDALLESESGAISSDYPRSLLREVCRKLGVHQYKGYDVDRYFSDEAIDESPLRDEGENPRFRGGH